VGHQQAMSHQRCPGCQMPGDDIDDRGTTLANTTRADAVPVTLGIDVGGVLTDRVAATPDTSFFGDRPMETPAVPGALEAVRALSAAFDHRVYVVSKAGPKISELTRQWLGTHGFLGDDNIPAGHIRFVRRREDKHPICEQLGITHFVDDRTDVLDHLLTVPYRYLLTAGIGTDPSAVRLASGIAVLDTWPAVVQAILGSPPFVVCQSQPCGERQRPFAPARPEPARGWGPAPAAH